MTDVIRRWAPHLKQLALELVDSGTRVAMTETSPGVFEAPRAAVTGPYMLRLDGDDGDRIPDPWAAAVDSLDGPCRLVDPAAFHWTDAKFAPPALADGLIYELHVGTFTPAGTFDGVAKQLPYLVELGVTHLELMPVATWSGNRGWGYDGAALFAPHPAYGGPDGLARLVDAAHAHGVAVILDVVYNHLGPIGNYLPRLGPFFRDDRSTPWGHAINFDGADSDEVRRFVLDNALHWLRDYHIDGLRLDAIHALADDSATHILEELRIAVDGLAAELGKPLVLIAESDLNDPRTVRPRAEHGHGMDAQWSDDFHHALHVALTGEQTGYYADFGGGEGLTDLAHALASGFVYAGQHAKFRRRRHGRALDTPALSRLVGYAQTHDQVGNRACGERLAQLVSPARLALAATLVLTGPFIPMLFMGEEWGASTPFQFFTDHQDAGVAQATRDGRRREFAAFGWAPDDVPDPQDAATFERSKLRWDERTRSPHAELAAYTRALIALREAEPALRGGSVDPSRVRVFADVLQMTRGRFVVLCNFGAATTLALPNGAWTRVLTSPGADVVVAADRVTLPADAAAVLVLGAA